MKIIHVYREGNYAADFLTSRGNYLSVGFHCIEVNDPMLSYWLLHDQFGVSEERLIMNELKKLCN
ncbi:hypothetical protein LINPERPRIM_LOCUS12323 [Linum perenne]